MKTSFWRLAATIAAQRRDIKEMEWLMSGIADNDTASTTSGAVGRSVPSFEGTLNP